MLLALADSGGRDLGLMSVYGTSRQFRSVRHSVVVEPELAIRLAEIAMRLSPRDFLNVVWHITAAWVHLSAERFEAAADSARRAVDWNPAFADAHGVLAAASAYLGRMADARASLDILAGLVRGSLSDQLAARPFRRSADRARYMEGLRKAGLPKK
jgi:hypothetical protein